VGGLREQVAELESATSVLLFDDALVSVHLADLRQRPADHHRVGRANRHPVSRESLSARRKAADIALSRPRAISLG
jgi:hypothetical protein